ncbi:hypothetical protein [Hymenobacter cheonanensis]|uniref:hypothetical protein n=1 Tax=Hymenobacter sp. CA2-7 TaxID=3063993 RepID=UPI00271359A2|nr:hypothetical protein [Hymenobacter sp. CA2-7]MDO7887021.1 hypothetical protein [Hymenobacter sp. CA2-7]
MRRSLSLFLLFFSLASHAQTPAETNKQLFDRTIDELNFRTFETVYDKHFTRQKYPATLRTAAARRQFAGFENNAELQKLFLNYNGVAERYKARFGNGPLSQAEFEKQLNGVVRDRNFEFFIRGLPRDERSALIRTEQRLIKQATAQFNASGAASKPAPQPEEPLAVAAPLTTNGPAPGEAEPAASPAAEPEMRPTSAALSETAPATSGPGWVGYFTLLLSLGSFGLLLYTVASLLPELNRLRRRVRDLESEQTYYDDPAGTDAEPDQPAPPAARGPGFFSRFKPQSTGELPADSYDDTDDEHN